MAMTVILSFKSLIDIFIHDAHRNRRVEKEKRIVEPRLEGVGLYTKLSNEFFEISR